MTTIKQLECNAYEIERGQTVWHLRLEHDAWRVDEFDDMGWVDGVDAATFQEAINLTLEPLA